MFSPNITYDVRVGNDTGVHTTISITLYIIQQTPYTTISITLHIIQPIPYTLYSKHLIHYTANTLHIIQQTRYTLYNRYVIRGTRLPKLSRETKFSGGNADREIFIFPVQLTTSRSGNLTWLINTLAICVTIHTYIHTLYCQYLIHYTANTLYITVGRNS